MKQTKEAVKGLPPLFEAAFFIWSSVPIWVIVPKINYSNFPKTALVFFFVLIWIAGTLSILLMSAFQRENKEALRKHVEENFTRKINSQTFAYAMLSKSGYEHLITRLPPHLTSDLGLYVAAKWGRFSKVMMIILIVVCFIV